MELTSESIIDGKRIPDRYCFCNLPDGGEEHVKMGANVSPHLRWSRAPQGTRSFAVLCWDPDVPSRPDDVNQEGRTVPKDLERVDFAHWVLVDVPADRTELAEGIDSKGITPRGEAPGRRPYGVTGRNDYTDWFAGDAEMGGTYGGYDGPCPPWNDERLHHYHFGVYALDVETLGLDGPFTLADARKAMEGHVLATAEICGTYSLNPGVG